jgi:hypothetical protein
MPGFLSGLFSPTGTHDPLGLNALINDQSTVASDVLGPSGVVDDLLHQDEGRVEAVLADIGGNGGVLDNLINDQGLGYQHLLAPDTVGGNVAGSGGLIDDLLG